MKKYGFSFLLIFSGVFGEAQTLLTPGTAAFDKKLLKNGTYEMACYAAVDGQQREISTFTININANSKTLSVATALKMSGSSAAGLLDTSIADAATFKPIYRSSFSPDKEMVLHYGKEATGYYFDKRAKKRFSIKDVVNEGYFDSYVYPYLLGLLPLTTGYKNELAVYEYRPGNKTNTKKARIDEVKSNVYKSSLTGEHKCWQVNVVEEATNDYFVYYIDKDTRRLWKVEIQTGGQRLALIDKEIDYNPFTTHFDKEQTLKLVKSGNAIILGQAFARDNQGNIQGMAVLNFHKKQFAQPGTSIILIPYTDFFKEWYKLNETARKKGRSIPLPKEATDCIKVSTVYDNEGHFEFTSLMPGEYMLYTEFSYVHAYTTREVVGYTDTYINGIFQGTSANTANFDHTTNVAATVKKTITIKEGEEKVEVKLKKTL